MSIRKTVTRENAHAIYASADGAWKWYILKTYATPAGEAKNNYARWFCLVTSPMVGETGEMGDTYIADIKRNATLESSTPEWREAYKLDANTKLNSHGHRVMKKRWNDFTGEWEENICS